LQFLRDRRDVIEISQGDARSVNAPDMRAAARDYA
jgi:hypothetical protein